MKLLLTGFEPFGGETVNPSWQAVCLVPEQIGTVTVVKRCLPTSFARAGTVLTDAIAALRPDAVLCVGQAGGRAAVTPERAALNLDDARIPDNDGACPADAPIVPGGPAAYFATLPVKAMAAAIGAAGVPAAVSNTAGTFVCNHVLYLLLHTLAAQYPGVRGGFVHIPYAPEQTRAKPGQPALPVADAARALAAAIAVLDAPASGL